MREEWEIRGIKEGIEQGYENIKQQLKEGKIPEEKIPEVEKNLGWIQKEIDLLSWVLGEKQKPR